MGDQQAANKRRKQEAERVWSERKEEIEWLYCEQDWSQKKIGSYYEVTQGCIRQVMLRIGIKARTRANCGSKNGRYKDGTQSRLYRALIVKDKCSRCNSEDKLVIHHKNGDHFDNHLDNLQILCESCHNSLTMKLWWDKKKGLKR